MHPFSEPMTPWYEVYDDVQLHLLTRNQVAKLTATAAVALMFAIACLAFGLEGSVPPALAAPVGGGVVVLLAWRSTIHLRRLRRLVWCIKLSDREVVGYDYARRRVTIAWASAERIEIGDKSLIVVGPHPDSLEIAHLFQDFAEVSHRIVHYADTSRVPVFVGGKPWQQLDVYDLYPFLSEDTSSSTHGSAAA